VFITKAIIKNQNPEDSESLVSVESSEMVLEIEENIRQMEMMKLRGDIFNLENDLEMLKDFLGVVKITEPKQPEKSYFTDDKDMVRWVKYCDSGHYGDCFDIAEIVCPNEVYGKMDECEQLKDKLGL